MPEEIEKFRQKYEEIRPRFDRLGNSVVLSLNDLLSQAGTSILDIASRTKSLESAREKFIRKEYSDPFSEMEDWCGVRVICYYPSDVEKIAKIIRQEFIVSSEENTAERLGPQEFGYRSTHLIVRMKPEWLHVPAHRGLKDLKAELQIRTVLMHAWAEIQHKLAYKSQEQVPENFQRQLYRLSAKFEEADEQFDTLRRGLHRYRRQIAVSAKDKKLSEIPMNLDTFIGFLALNYPNRKANREHAALLLTEIQKLRLSFKDLQSAVDAQKSVIHLFAERDSIWSQVGALRNALDLSNDEFLMTRKQMTVSSPWYQTLKTGREALGKKLPW